MPRWRRRPTRPRAAERGVGRADQPPDPTFADGAEAELLKALAYYARRRSGLGLAFLAAVEQTVARAAEAPGAGAPLGGSGGARRAEAA